jgi:hypothetical protein
MAIAYVRDSGVQTGASVATDAVNLTLPTVGNHLIVTSSNNTAGTGHTITSVVDNQSSQVYAKDIEITDAESDGCGAAIFSTKVLTSGGTFTVTIDPAATAWIAWLVAEYSGLDATTHLDRTGSLSSTSSSTDASVGTANMSGANSVDDELVIAVASVHADDTTMNFTTPSADYTERAVYQDSNAIVGFESADKILAGGAGTTMSATWTHDNTSQVGWAAVIATYAPAAAAVTVVTGQDAVKIAA